MSAPAARLVDLGPAAAEPLAEVHATAFNRPWAANDLIDMMQNLGARALALQDDGRLLGFVLFQTTAGEGEILTLAVRPEARRQGVGLRLVEAAAEAAAAAEAQTLWLEVAADNAAALALYTRAGFEALGQRRGYYRIGPNHSIDAVVMRRALNSDEASPYSS